MSPFDSSLAFLLTYLEELVAVRLLSISQDFRLLAI